MLRLTATLLGAVCLAGIASTADAQMVTRTVVTESYGEPVYYAPPPAVIYGGPVYYRPYYRPYRYYAPPPPVVVEPYAPALFSFNIGGGGRYRGYDDGRHWRH